MAPLAGGGGQSFLQIHMSPPESYNLPESLSILDKGGDCGTGEWLRYNSGADYCLSYIIILVTGISLVMLGRLLVLIVVGTSDGQDALDEDNNDIRSYARRTSTTTAIGRGSSRRWVSTCSVVLEEDEGEEECEDISQVGQGRGLGGERSWVESDNHDHENYAEGVLNVRQVDVDHDGYDSFSSSSSSSSSIGDVEEEWGSYYHSVAPAGLPFWKRFWRLTEIVRVVSWDEKKMR